MKNEFREEMGEHVRGALMYIPRLARQQVREGCHFNLIDRRLAGRYVPRKIAGGGRNRIDLILDRDSCVMKVTYTTLHECAHHVLGHGQNAGDPVEAEFEADHLVEQWIAPHAETIEFKGKTKCGRCPYWDTFCEHFEKK